MTERKVKLDRANKSILLRALGDVYYGQRANGGSTEVTGRLILRVNDLPAGGNVYQLVLSVSNYDTTPFSSQNQSKMFKKSVDLQQLRLCKPMILQHSLLFLNYSLTSTGFLSKNYAN